MRADAFRRKSLLDLLREYGLGIEVAEASVRQSVLSCSTQIVRRSGSASS
jgi:hypothetical protein